jgi:hypothetical protein
MTKVSTRRLSLPSESSAFRPYTSYEMLRTSVVNRTAKTVEMELQEKGEYGE